MGVDVGAEAGTAVGAGSGTGAWAVRRAGRWLAVLLSLVVCSLAVRVSPAEAAPVQATRGPDGSWTWPLAGEPPVVRGYAPPAQRYGAGHRGVDLGGAPGAPVLAAGDGEVAWAGVLAGRGVVVVRHGELRTTYEPVTATVAVGTRVGVGQPVGILEAGHPGCATPACLHWGLKRGEQYLDPLSLVGAGPVRLLPVLDAAGRQGAAAAGQQGTDAAGQQDPAAPALGAARSSGATAPEPAASPGFNLRAATTPSGALAVVALLAGLALLCGRRPPRGRPPTAAAVGRPGGTATAGPQAPEDDPAAVVQLAEERARRRPA